MTDEPTPGTGVPVVDCHAHTVPETFLADLARRPAGGGIEVWRTDGGFAIVVPGAPERQIRPRMSGLAPRLASMTEQRIDRQLVAPWLDIQPTAAMPPADARSWARRINDALLGMADEGAAAAAGVLGSVALHDPDHAADDLDTAVGAGMAGLILSTDPAHCDTLGDPRLEPVWAAAEQLGIPVMLHPSADGPSRALPGSAAFGNVYCRLVDTSFAVARLILAGVLDRHPKLRLITVHGGGLVPFQSGRLDGGHRADALSSYRIDRDRPSDYLADLYYDTVALSPAAIRFLVEAVGPGRVLLGTDYPFALGDPDPVGAVESVQLDRTDRDAILGGNVLSILERN
ncbi:amidohydrolase family protein [Pseudonocardia endophytica]|uniref:Aminocarboxymuconate-semialdehyde decarboxylase n=1 Tax=Pseudonocardia endophytica TaxID=401976 RepID=A0A4R1HHX0_PSEEN|nr:amidohydrolase family protein [Pseudonocardia endophytica]TCK21827.1 aminocarboxymuconate-semialdehyde decarboxylase [Pseudonocardia endophytica]